MLVVRLRNQDLFRLESGASEYTENLLHGDFFLLLSPRTFGIPFLGFLPAGSYPTENKSVALTNLKKMIIYPFKRRNPLVLVARSRQSPRRLRGFFYLDSKPPKSRKVSPFQTRGTNDRSFQLACQFVRVRSQDEPNPRTIEEMSYGTSIPCPCRSVKIFSRKLFIYTRPEFAFSSSIRNVPETNQR